MNIGIYMLFNIAASFVLFCTIYTYLLFWRFNTKREDTNRGVLIGFVCILCSFLFNIFIYLPVIYTIFHLFTFESGVSFVLLKTLKSSVLVSLRYCIHHVLGLLILCFADRKYFIYEFICIVILNYFITVIFKLPIFLLFT